MLGSIRLLAKNVEGPGRTGLSSHISLLHPTHVIFLSFSFLICEMEPVKMASKMVGRTRSWAGLALNSVPGAGRLVKMTWQQSPKRQLSRLDQASGPEQGPHPLYEANVKAHLFCEDLLSSFSAHLGSSFRQLDPTVSRLLFLALSYCRGYWDGDSTAQHICPLPILFERKSPLCDTGRI